MVKKILNKVLNRMGYQIQKKVEPNNNPTSNNNFTMLAALERSLERGLNVKTVIDVGASDGQWSRECMKIFPESNYILIEAQEIHKDKLENFKKAHPKVSFVLAAAGQLTGKVYFDASDPFGGVASNTQLNKNFIEVPMVLVDDVVSQMAGKEPYLLKLDTHGFEIPILEGAKETLKKAGLVIIETYNFKLTKDSLRYWELCTYMEGLGFAPIENVDFMLRKRDKAFWQMDTFFLPIQDPIFSKNTYS